MKDYLLRHSSSGGVFLGGSPVIPQAFEYFKSENLTDDVVMIKLNFERATSYEAPEFKNFVTQRIESGIKKMVVDLRKVEIIDSTFIGALIFALKKLKANNGKLKLIMNENNIPASFTATSLIEVFDIYYTEEAAVYSLRSA